MYVDFHWHARDEEQAYKETIAHSLAVAEAVGLDAIAAMPNVERPLITLERCQEYLSIAHALKSEVQFFVHIGLTTDREQVKRAVAAWRQEMDIIGMKAYWEHSTGNLGIVQEEDQYQVLETLAQEGFDGVLVNHCEKQSLIQSGYDSRYPSTWSTYYHPEKAEIVSFKEILSMAENVKFGGSLHIAHVSTIEVVDEIDEYTGRIPLTCGITPHHLLFDYAMMRGKHASWYKCNPPLRSGRTRLGLVQRLVNGKIPIIESDHAPQTIKDKEAEIPASGIPSGVAWPYVVKFLQQQGMSEEQLTKATFTNAIDLYNLDIEPRKRSIDWERVRQLHKDYPCAPNWNGIR